MNAINYIIRSFQTYYPMAAKDAVSYRKVGKLAIIATLTDGAEVLYNHLRNTIRWMPKDYMNVTETEFRKEFSRRLIDILEHACISQSDLANMTGISQVSISNYITLKSTPSFYNVDKIAKALKCSVDDLRYVK